jgi:hypothetical protein
VRDVSSLWIAGRGIEVLDVMRSWRYAIVGIELERYSESKGMLVDTTSVYEFGGVRLDKPMWYDRIVGVLLVEFENMR